MSDIPNSFDELLKVYLQRCAEVEDLKSRLALHEAEISRLRLNEVNLRVKEGNLQAKLERELNDAKNSHSVISESLRQQVASLERQLEDAKQDVDRMGAVINKQATDERDLQKQLEEAKAEIATKDQTISRQFEEIGRLKWELGVYRVEAATHDQIGELTRKNEELEKACGGWRQIAESKDRTISELISERGRLVGDWCGERSELNRKRKELQQKLSDLEVKLGDSKLVEDLCDAARNKLTDENIQLKTQLDAEKGEVAFLQSIRLSQAKMIDKQRQEIATLRVEAKELEGDRDKFREDLRVTEATSRRLADMNDAQNITIRSLREEIERWRGLCTGQQEKIRDLEAIHVKWLDQCPPVQKLATSGPSITRPVPAVDAWVAWSGDSIYAYEVKSVETINGETRIKTGGMSILLQPLHVTGPTDRGPWRKIGELR